MKNEVIITGDTLQECRVKASDILDCKPSQIRIEVLESAKSFFFSKRPYKVKATVKKSENSAPKETEPPQNSATIINRLDKHLTSIEEEFNRLNDLIEEQPFTSELNIDDELDLKSILPPDMLDKISSAKPQPGSFHIFVDTNHMTVSIELHPPANGGEAVTINHIVAELEKRSITVFSRKTIQGYLDYCNLLKRAIYDSVIGEGTPAENGTDGFIEFHVEFPEPQKFREKEDGKIDFKTIVGICEVEKGQHLATLHHPTQGKAGMDIFSNPLNPVPGKPAQFRVGKNVVMDESNGRFYAAESGAFKFVGKRLIVEPTFFVAGDVDMRTGHVEFHGNIVVKGTVRDGFFVRAKGDIHIEEGAEACQIISDTGSIVIEQGISGKNRSFISAAIDVITSHIEHATVYAGNNIDAGAAILYSEVIAGNELHAKAGKGAVIGGSIKAGKLVNINEAGSPAETITHIAVGIKPDQAHRLKELDQRIVSLKNVCFRMEQLITRFSNLTEASPEIDMKLEAAQKKYATVVFEIKRCEKERQNLKKKIGTERTGRINVSNIAYPRVHLQVGNIRELLAEKFKQIVFSASPSEDEIVKNTLKITSGKDKK